MRLEPITSTLETTSNAKEGDVARKIAEHMGLLRGSDGRVYGPDGEPVASDLIALHDIFSTLMWTSVVMHGWAGFTRHIHWERIGTPKEVAEMARRRNQL